MIGKEADLVLFAGRAGEAYLAFGKFKDDPLVIVPWRHNAAPGAALAWWRCGDWEDLLRRIRRAPTDKTQAVIIRAAMPPEARKQLRPETLL